MGSCRTAEGRRRKAGGGEVLHLRSDRWAAVGTGEAEWGRRIRGYGTEGHTGEPDVDGSLRPHRSGGDRLRQRAQSIPEGRR